MVGGMGKESLSEEQMVCLPSDEEGDVFEGDVDFSKKATDASTPVYDRNRKISVISVDRVFENGNAHLLGDLDCVLPSVMETGLSDPVTGNKGE